MNTERELASLFEGFSLFSLLILFLVMIATSISTGDSLFLVLLGFSPAMFTIILSIILYEESKERKVFIWGLPLIIIGLFFFIVQEQTFLRSNLDVNALVGINLMISLFYLGLFFLSTKSILNKPKKKPKQLVNALEDKSKAINFAIGRVYGKSKGGSKALREKIKIKQEWYNEVSKFFKRQKSDKNDLKKSLKKIDMRLQKLKKTEKEVFGKKHTNFKNLARDKTGNDRIIDVITRNDNDPVGNYYMQLQENIKTLRKEIHRR